MADALHRAIEDALRDAPAYEGKGILVTTLLEARRPLHAEGSLLYRAVYTIFRALPDRLLPGSLLSISTTDVDDGVELVWEGREALVDGSPRAGGLRDLLGQGPHGDLITIALQALETYCNVRAGFVETRSRRVESSSFERPAHVVRRVTAHIPALRTEAGRERAPPVEAREAAARASRADNEKGDAAA